VTTSFRNLLSVLAISVFVFLALASSGVKHMTFTKDAGQIPPDFSKFKDTLLVISHSDDWGYNKYLRKNFQGSYTGNYKIIKPSEIGDYSPDKYRYIFDHSLNYASKTTTTYTPITGGGHVINGSSNISSHTSTYASSDVFFIKDRKINQDYVTKSSSYYSKLMRAYIMALDEERQK
jgi:hypothetical protein